MEKVTIHQFDPEIYPFKIWVCISDNHDEVVKSFLNSETDKPFAECDLSHLSAYASKVIHRESRLYGTLLTFRSKDDMSPAIVAHEASHAAKFLFEHISADVAPHEPFEYLLGWIVDKCFIVKEYETKE